MPWSAGATMTGTGENQEMAEPTLQLQALVPGRASASRELLVLGTAAQAPTRERNHNGYLLRWDGKAILFDPGEGTQRQLLHADVSSGSISAICITHFHGDHCLGLPGVLARFALDHRARPVDLFFPAAGAGHLDRLRRVAAFEPWPHVRLHPLPAERTVTELPDGLRLVAQPLHHTIPTLGWRIEEPARRHVIAERAAAYGLAGPEIGRVVRGDTVETASGPVRLEDVSETRPSQAFALLMDTAPCDGAVALADRADLVLTESTYLESEIDLAGGYRHLTARQAALIAKTAGARALVLTHFSQRHRDESVFAAEAEHVFPEVVAAHDLTVVAVPERVSAPSDQGPRRNGG
jgi:ribonuclease Z